MKNGEEKRRRITLKKGGKGLKNASYLGYNLRPARRKTYLLGKKINLKRGGRGKMIKMYNIYPCVYFKNNFDH